MLPIGKGQGKSLTMLLQCQLPHALFTSLEDFKQCGYTVTVLPRPHGTRRVTARFTMLFAW